MEWEHIVRQSFGNIDLQSNLKPSLLEIKVHWSQENLPPITSTGQEDKVEISISLRALVSGAESVATTSSSPELGLPQGELIELCAKVNN